MTILRDKRGGGKEEKDRGEKMGVGGFKSVGPCGTA